MIGPRNKRTKIRSLDRMNRIYRMGIIDRDSEILTVLADGHWREDAKHDD
jgi:hypothetical protein